METYVCGEDEVKLTGRIATRPVGGKVQELVEVTPSNPDNGTWTKWTTKSAMFKVQQTESK